MVNSPDQVRPKTEKLSYNYDMRFRTPVKDHEAYVKAERVYRQQQVVYTEGSFFQADNNPKH